MERIKEMGKYQRGVLFLSLAMIVIFTVLYPLLYPRVGFMCNNDYAYPSAFLEMRKEDGITVYEGWVKGKKLTFRVEKADTLICYYGDKTYGPFTARRDPSAVPKTNGAARDMVGVEIREGEEVLFRGGVLMLDEESLSMRLVEETDTDPNHNIIISNGNNWIHDEEDTNDRMKPTEYTILSLLAGPKLIHKANWWGWIAGMYFAVCTALYALFPDELFRFRMSFRVYNTENLYPSDWEIASRYIGWTACAGIALISFVMGLIPQL